jgi:S-(hydroxymethyl)glutathione dehydrogenase/alcohol dehydrogenase
MDEDQSAKRARNVSRRALLQGGVVGGGAAALAQAAQAAQTAPAVSDGRRDPSPEVGPPRERSIRIDKTFRALVRRNPAENARIETVKLLPFGGRQVLVRCTVNQCCYTDTGNVLAGNQIGGAPRPPAIVGHAGMGVVEAIGPEVRWVRPGDKVFIAGTAQCNLCYNCIRGRTDACLANNLQQGPVAVTADGMEIVQNGGIGGYAEYSVNYEERLVPYFSDLPDEEVSMMIDVGSTGLGMACCLRPIEAGSTVVVIGCGPIGLSAVQGARIQGASHIIAVEPIAARRKLALELGAHEAVDPNAFPPAELLAHLRRMTGRGKPSRLFAGGSPPDLFTGPWAADIAGPDYVIEAVGHQRFTPKLESPRDPSGIEALELACNLAPKGGCIMLGGGYAANDTVTLNANGLTLRSRTIISCQNGGIQTRRDIPRFIELIEKGQFNAKAMISKVYKFDDVIQAFQDVADRTVVGAVVRF